MMYPGLKLPTVSGRPFFYSNFVSTLDGKIQVNRDSEKYWPIGTELDYATLIELRTHTDALIHGRKTATWIRTLDRLGSPSFQESRREQGKTKPLLYVVISAHPHDTLVPFLENPPKGTKALLATTDEARLPKKLSETVEVVRLGKKKVDTVRFADYLQQKGVRKALIEGGPHLLTSFLEKNLVDELFMTLAPKLFGNEEGLTLTMTEGKLFAPNDVKKFRLLSAKPVDNEVYLHYARQAD